MVSIDLNSLSIEDSKNKKDKKSKLKKECNEYKKQQEKQKLVHEIMRIESKQKRLLKAKYTPKVKSKQKPKHQIKTCIQNKKIPKTPHLILKKLLEGQRENTQMVSNMKFQVLIILLKKKTS